MLLTSNNVSIETKPGQDLTNAEVEAVVKAMEEAHDKLEAFVASIIPAAVLDRVKITAELS